MFLCGCDKIVGLKRPSDINKKLTFGKKWSVCWPETTILGQLICNKVCLGDL